MNSVKYKSLKKILYLASSLFVVLLFFQNCNSGMALSDSDPISLNTFSSSTENIPPKDPTEIIFSGGSYIFYGKFNVNPNDPKGNQVCNFPSLNNCSTSANGKSRGALIEKNSGLDPKARLHKMTFDFQSNGFLAKNPAAHIAVGIRGRITEDLAGDPVAVNGRGFLIGHHAGGGDPRNNNNPACLTNMLQVESYHGDISRIDPKIPANHIFSDTCTGSIFSEAVWYKLELYVSTDRKIGYRVLDQNSKLIRSFLISDPYNYLDPNIADFFLAHVFENDVLNPNGNWNFIIRDVKLIQSESNIEKYFTN